MLESLFNKVASLKGCNFIKKRLQQWCFPGNIAKFLRTAFFYRTPLVAASGENSVKQSVLVRTEIQENIFIKQLKYIMMKQNKIHYLKSVLYCQMNMIKFIEFDEFERLVMENVKFVV